jgi:opacity protein-like surface antigen
MKNIMMAAVLIVISFAFVSEINAKDIEGVSWDEAIEGAVPLEMLGSTTAAKPVSKKDEQPAKEELQKIADDSNVPVIKVPKGTFEPEPTEPKFSVSIGLGNAYKLGVEFEGEKMGLGMNNSPAFTARFGYSLNKYVEVQGEYSKATNFENSYKEEDNIGFKYDWKNQHVFSTYIANLKLTIPLTIDKVIFSPYIFGGLGRATFKSVNGLKEYHNGTKIMDTTDTERYSGNCLKTGAGVDLKVYKNLFLFSEYSFQKINLRIDGQKITLYYSQMIGGIGLKF